MGESYTHMEANKITFEDYTNLSEVQLTREQQETYLAALVREKEGNETRLAQLEAAETPDQAAIKHLKDDIAAVKAELARVGGVAEPRNKVAK